jgi:hypothetical protein
MGTRTMPIQPLILGLGFGTNPGVLAWISEAKSRRINEFPLCPEPGALPG